MPKLYVETFSGLFGGSWDLVSAVISTLIGAISNYRYSYVIYNGFRAQGSHSNMFPSTAKSLRVKGLGLIYTLEVMFSWFQRIWLISYCLNRLK